MKQLRQMSILGAGGYSFVLLVLRTFYGCMAGAGCREKACIRDGSFGS